MKRFDKNSGAREMMSRYILLCLELAFFTFKRCPSLNDKLLHHHIYGTSGREH